MKSNSKKTPKAKSKKMPVVTLKEKIHRHLTDKNDVISDQDILEVKVGEDDSEKGFRIEAPKETPDKKSTPWDVLSEGYD